MQKKQKIVTEVENLFIQTLDSERLYKDRRFSSRNLIEAIIKYLFYLYDGGAAMSRYNNTHKRQLDDNKFNDLVDILVDLSKFPYEYSVGAKFIYKDSSLHLHFSKNLNNADVNETYIDLVILTLNPIVEWFFYEELKCNANELRINELILDYKKNHLNYSEKIVYENNFDMDKIIEELKKQNVAIKNNVNPVITNNNEVSPVTNVIINNEGHKNVDFISIKYMLVIIGSICLIFLMFIIFKQSNFSFNESEHKSQNMPPINDSSSNLDGITISNYGNEVKSTVYGNIENSKDEKK